MFSFPPPPEAPDEAEEFLRQLADYYQQLQEYHQRAAAAAAQQLAHLQCLLSPPTEGVLTTAVAEQVRETQAGAIPALLKEATQPALSSNTEAQMPRIVSWLEIKDILEEGRGKMLHLGFIVRQLYGRLPPEILAPVTERTRQKLTEGAKEEKWFAVPDSPDCWTIDLREFPDWAEPEAGEEAAIPASALLTKEACQRLGISQNQLHDYRRRYADQLREGVHYFWDERQWLYWTEEGLVLLQQLGQADSLTNKGRPNQATRQVSGTQEEMIPPYQGLSAQEALKKLFPENRGRILANAEIVSCLYGDLNQAKLTKMKDRIGKILSKGTFQGWWQRVPGRVGFYTADLKDLSETDS